MHHLHDVCLNSRFHISMIFHSSLHSGKRIFGFWLAERERDTPPSHGVPPLCGTACANLRSDFYPIIVSASRGFDMICATTRLKVALIILMKCWEVYTAVKSSSQTRFLKKCACFEESRWIVGKPGKKSDEYVFLFFYNEHCHANNSGLFY